MDEDKHHPAESQPQEQKVVSFVQQSQAGNSYYPGIYRPDGDN
jgi:hypothetical protein